MQEAIEAKRRALQAELRAVEERLAAAAEALEEVRRLNMRRVALAGALAVLKELCPAESEGA